MNNTIFFSIPMRAVMAAAWWLGSAWCAPVQASTGEGVVAAVVGQAEARVFSGPVHEGRTEKRDLFQGASIGERTRVTTGKDGHLCLVLTPGALMHVPPETDLTLVQLRHTADGLPRSEDDLVRRIVVEVRKGRVYVNGGVPTPSLDIRVETPAGVVAANGGIFSVAQESPEEWTVWCEEYQVSLLTKDGKSRTLAAGDLGAMPPRRGNPTALGQPPSNHEFTLCRGYFRDLEDYRHMVRGFDREGISQYMGLSGPPIYLGAQGLIADVSPSFRPTTAATAAPIPPNGIGGPDGRRWGDDRIWSWWDSVGVIRGVNYVPRNCVNSTEMWMEDTFDPDIIDEELKWAKDLGYTAIRIPLQEAVWRNDPKGFMDRFENFLELAHGNGLLVVPVLFDDLNRARREATVGPQPDPIPGVHNAQWTPNPGPSRVKDQSAWPELEKYTRDVVGNHKRDRRILYWDLYNTAGNDDLWEQTLPLMDQVFNWVRDIDPRQPLAVSAWKNFGSPMAARKLERSDIITFQSFENPELVEAKVQLLQRYKRPLVASDWLMRQQDNTFEKILPIFANYGVGWFNRGLVQGRTQTWIQQEQFRSPADPELWQHDVLKEDGSPYREEEADLIQGFRYVTN